MGNLLNTCDSPPLMTDFNVEAYAGTWYNQWHKTGQTFAPDDATCTQAIYSDLQDDGSFTVGNSYQDKDFGEREYATGWGSCPDESGQCYVQFWYIPPFSPNYIVLATDYESFSIVYSCDWKSSSLWILTRDQVPDPMLFTKL